VHLPQEVESIAAAMAGPDYAPNSAQRRLAEEVTRFVHGEEGLRQALAATQVRFLGSVWPATCQKLQGRLPEARAAVPAPGTQWLLRPVLLEASGPP